jgi:hypothetical protein
MFQRIEAFTPEELKALLTRLAADYTRFTITCESTENIESTDDMPADFIMCTSQSHTIFGPFNLESVYLLIDTWSPTRQPKTIRLANLDTNKYMNINILSREVEVIGSTPTLSKEDKETLNIRTLTYNV